MSRPLPPTGTGDEELDALFAAEPDLADTARLLRSAAPEEEMDHVFTMQLRKQLMREAETVLQPRRQSWLRRQLGTLPALLAGSGGVALVAATLFLVLQPTAPGQVRAPHGTPQTQDQAITVAFDQPMNHDAVVAGLHIQPATSYTTSWSGNTLTIKPVHQLTANTAYTVTIDRTAVVSESGMAATEPVQFVFGTPPTPTPNPSPSPSQAPQLTPSLLAQLPGAHLLGFTADGQAIVSADSGTFVVHAGATPQRVGDTATAAAASIDGTSLALATANSKGGSSIFISGADAKVTSLGDTDKPVVALTWTSATSLTVVTTQTVTDTHLDGSRHEMAPAADGEHFTGSSASARFVVALSANGARVIDLSDGSATTLESATSVVWSADGAAFSWVRSGDPRTLCVAVTNDLANPSHIQVPASLGDIASLALNGDGTQVLVIDGSGASALLNTRDGSIIATVHGTQTTALFVPASNDVILVDAAGDVASVTVPASTSVATATPPAATHAVDAFLASQVAGTKPDGVAPGVDTSATPEHLSRSYVIDTVVADDGTVTVHARLVVDASAQNMTASHADETLTVTPGANAAYSISAVTIGALVSDSHGPHVIHAAAGRNTSVISIAFDSDLDVTSVVAAVSAKDRAGVLHTSVVYDAATRTVTVTILGKLHGAVTVSVSTGLHDIAGQPLSDAYSLTLKP